MSTIPAEIEIKHIDPSFTFQGNGLISLSEQFSFPELRYYLNIPTAIFIHVHVPWLGGIFKNDPPHMKRNRSTKDYSYSPPRFQKSVCKM